MRTRQRGCLVEKRDDLVLAAQLGRRAACPQVRAMSTRIDRDHPLGERQRFLEVFRQQMML